MMIFYLSADVEFLTKILWVEPELLFNFCYTWVKQAEVNWFTQGHKEATLNTSVSTSWD